MVYKSVIVFPPETELTGWIGDETPVEEIPFIHHTFDNTLANIGTMYSAQPTGYGTIVYDNTLYTQGTHSIRFQGQISSPQYVAYDEDIQTPNLQGMTISLNIYPRSVGKLTTANSHVFMMYGDNTTTCKMSLVQDDTRITDFKIGPLPVVISVTPDTWTNLVITVSNNRVLSVYKDGVPIPRLTNIYNSFYFKPDQFISTFLIGRHSSVGLSSFNGNIDDFRLFDYEMNSSQVDSLLNFESVSRLKLRLTLQTDATDKTGNYSGVVFGNCITNQRAKYGSFSLTSNGIVGSTKYIQMPELDLINDKGMTFSFWFYNKSGQSTADSRLFEATTDMDTNSLYIQQFQLDRTKFQFTTSTDCIFHATPLDSWHQIVCTISKDNKVSIWIDGMQEVVNVIVANSMPTSKLDANWRIGANLSSSTTLCSFDGSIQEFKIWNRVLSHTEVQEVV